jgi:hypothetical protein
VKLIWYFFVGSMILNLLLAAGYVGYKYSGGYINTERIQRAMDTFELTIEEEAAQAEEVQLLEEKHKKDRDQVARLESTGKGSRTINDELRKTTQADQTALERINLFNDQNKALRDEMTRFKLDHDRRVAKLQKQRADFEKWIKDRAAQTSDENFQQVVRLYETQSPKQTKQAFQTLMSRGEIDQVVEYLAAMSSRKAGKVLGQFKAPEEVPQATELLEKLRRRGEYTLGQQTPTVENQS